MNTKPAASLKKLKEVFPPQRTSAVSCILSTMGCRKRRCEESTTTAMNATWLEDASAEVPCLWNQFKDDEVDVGGRR